MIQPIRKIDVLQRDNAELRAKLEETQERPFDLEYFVQQAAGDDVAIEITDYIKSLERNKRKLTRKTEELEQQLAEANDSVAQLRAALKLANEDLAMWHEAEGQNKCDGCYTCEELKPIIDKALSTTPSQAAERQKRIVEVEQYGR